MSVIRPFSTSIRLPARKWTLSGALILAFLASGLGGCVSSEEYKRLQTSFEESRRALAQAEYDLRNAQKKIEELNAKIAELNDLLAKGNGGVDALIRERDLLRAQLAEANAKIQELGNLAGKANPLPPVVNDALKRLALQYPDLLEFDERLGMLRLKSDLTFDVGSTEVKPAAKAALARVAQILDMQEIARNEIQVMGHTDDIPIRAGGPTAARNPDNWTLSTNRAWSVLDVLRTNGVSKDRGMAAGWGDQRPVAPNAAGNRGNEKNRRVDIYIKPTTVPEGIVVSTPGATPAPTNRPPAASRTPTSRPAASTRPAATSPAIPIPM
ncbi:MAG TPA: OmpA family protein [Phycisphaerae bacterium]|nr:OmpA family protein [Phycisphaerae bacterium]